MILLDRNSAKPLYIQIYEHIRDEIISGELIEGRRLSATRRQAETLGVSRNTVEQAYLQLCSEGYLENQRGSGYYVRHVDASLIDPVAVSKRMGNFHRESSESRKFLYDMRYGDCSMENFPLIKWRKSLEKALAGAADDRIASYGDNCGEKLLRSYLADYLERTRGVKCSPDQVIIGSGTQHLFGILCQLLELRNCAMEEPGYDGIRYVLENQGIDVLPVEVGEAGLCLEHLAGKTVGAVYVTPSHQFPMGMVMPIQARMELLRMAQNKNFFIIEDDYDSDFRYTAKTIPAMQGLDRYGRVVYMGSVSKVLAPSVRLAYMVLPSELKNKYDMWFSEYHNTVPFVIQDALRILMEDGSWERHIRKAVLMNRRKHDTLVEILEAQLEPEFALLAKGAGLHLILESKSLTGEEMIVRCQREGVNLYSMERYFIRGAGRNYAMVGFGGICVNDAKDVAERIARALKIGPEK